MNNIFDNFLDFLKGHKYYILAFIFLISIGLFQFFSKIGEINFKEKLKEKYIYSSKWIKLNNDKNKYDKELIKYNLHQQFVTIQIQKDFIEKNIKKEEKNGK